jgi:hypothetical protein
LPIKLEEPHIRLIKSGAFTVFGRDKFYRPVIIVKPLIFNNLGFEWNNDDLMLAVSYSIFYTRNHMMQEGKVENFSCIFDLEHAQPWSLPIKSMQTFSAGISTQFRCFSCRLYVVNACKAFVWSWKVISSCLNEIQRHKTLLTGENTHDDIKLNIPQHFLFKEYGGTADRPENSWPPTMPSI